jgi:hypothetical protein
LDERCRRGIEIDATNLRLAGQDGHVLSQCPAFRIRFEPFRDAIPHDLIRQDLAVTLGGWDDGRALSVEICGRGVELAPPQRVDEVAGDYHALALTVRRGLG